MNIAFALGHELPFPQRSGGGVNGLLSCLCVQLAAAGHEVVAYSPAHTELPVSEFVDGVRHIRVKGARKRKSNLMNFAVGLPYALRVKRALRSCDVFCSHLWHGFIVAPYSCTTALTHTIHRDPKRYLRLFGRFDRIYAGSESVIRDAAELLPSMSRLFKTVHNCVDFTNYSYKALPRRESNGKYVFTFIGRFSMDKGVETLIRAFAEAIHECKSLELRIIGPTEESGGGDSRLFEKMRAYVKERQLERSVLFKGPIFERALLDEAIRDSDAIVLPSVGGETLNMSILESMRIGRALLLYDLHANQPLAEDSRTGLFAEAGNIMEWKDRMLRLANDSELSTRLGAAAYEYGRRTFSTERIVQAYISDFNLIRSSKLHVSTV